MAQLKANRYADKHCGRGEPIHLVTLELSHEARNLVVFDVESA